MIVQAVFQREIARLGRQFPPEIGIKGYEVCAAGSFYVGQVAAVIILTDFQFFFSNPHSRGRLCHKILADAQSITPLHHLLSSITSSHSGQINDLPVPSSGSRNWVEIVTLRLTNKANKW
jgi:hypothetical protein